jgi:hypothetical protein
MYLKLPFTMEKFKMAVNAVCLPMVSGSLRVLQLLPTLKLVAMI